MCPYSGTRTRPFYIGIHANLPDGDIRHKIIRHLEHEIEGVLPPSGELVQKLSWAEIGVILPSPEKEKSGMVWICIPNDTKGDFEEKYKKLIKLIEADTLQFSYNKLTSNLFSGEALDGVKDYYKKLVESHFMTIKQNIAENCLFSDESCRNNHKITEDLCKDICTAVVSVVGCAPKEFCHWAEIVKVNLMKDASNGVPHTFFLILKPGSYFHEDMRTLRNNIIGSALFVWNSEPPAHQEILSLRRNLVNTLWLELGTKLQLLKLSQSAAVEIPALIELARKHDPFNQTTCEHHNDVHLQYRQAICKMMALRHGKGTCCNDCRTERRYIDQKEYKTNALGKESINDFCGSLDEYKGMFQRNKTQILMTGSRRNNFKTFKGSLFLIMASFLGLNIEIEKGVDEVKLPYSPSWLFLATIKLLSDTLKAEKIELFKIDEVGKWCMSIHFPLRPQGAEPTTSANNLTDTIESRGDKGEASSAILDVLHGRLGVLQDFMRECYPDDLFVKQIIAGNDNKLMDYAIGWDTNSLKVCFTWPMSEHLSVPRLKGFATTEEVQEDRDARRPNTLFLSVGEQCNLNCIYCYTVPRLLRPERQALSFIEQEKLLKDAASLGVRYLVIPGPGEPLLYSGLDRLVSAAIRLGLYITIITNGTCIDHERAMYYKDLPVSFMVKLNSLDKGVQDNLIGQSGMAEKIYRAIDILAKTGFTGFPETRLAIDALICQQTMSEIPDIVRFALERQIHPVVERLLPLGRGLTNRDSLEVDETAAAQVLREVQLIIGERGGNSFSGNVCDLHDYTLFMDVDGMVTKCVGGQREILIGDWRTDPLNNIWARQLNILAEDAKAHQSGPSCHQATKCPGRSYCETKYNVIPELIDILGEK